MKRLKFVVLLAILMALLVTGCIDMKPASEYETEDAVFVLRNGVIEVKAAKELSGLDVFMKADIAENAVISSGSLTIVKPFEEGTVIATAIGARTFGKDETIMTVKGDFEDLKALGIETESAYLEPGFSAQVQAPEDGVYIQDTWVREGQNEGFFIIGAKNIDSELPVVGFDLLVKYEEDDIEIDEIVALIPSDGRIFYEVEETAGEIDIQVAYLEENAFFIIDPYNLFKVNFTVKEGVVEETSLVELDSDDRFPNFSLFNSEIDDNPQGIRVAEHNGYITIGDPTLLGDFNLDGTVDDADLSLLADHYRSVENEGPYDQFFDIGPARRAFKCVFWAHLYTKAIPDGKIDITDLVILAQNYDFDKPEGFNYVTTLEELNAAIASQYFNPIVFGADIDGTAGIDTVTRLVDINLNGYTLDGSLNVELDDGVTGEMSLFAGTITGDLTVEAPGVTFNNYADVGGSTVIDDISNGTWNEFACNNTLIWNAAGKTLYIHCGAVLVIFNESANVFGGDKINEANVLSDGVVFDNLPITFTDPVVNIDKEEGYSTIQTAINNANEGDTIVVLPGTYVEVGQIVIDKNLTIIGNDKDTTIIKPAQDSGDSGDDRGWFLVEAGVEFNLSNVTLDGEGKKVYQAIRSLGSGTIDNNIIKNIKYSQYVGFGVVVMGDYNMTISNNTFTNIERIGIMAFGSGVTDAQIIGNTYTGKGPGDYLDYGIEIGGGAQAFISGNTISNCGPSETAWSSAAVMVNSLYADEGGVSKATVEGNTFFDNQFGINVGYNESDVCVFTASSNTFTNNGIQVGILDSVEADLEEILSNNTFDRAVVVRGSGIKVPTIFSSIQDAIDAAEAEDTVEVLPGTYRENLASWKDMEITKSLTLKGAGSGETVVELTENKGNGVEIRGSDLSVTIEGITFTKRPEATYASNFGLHIAETASTFIKLVLMDVEVAYAKASNVLLGSAGTFESVTVEYCNFHNAGTWGFLVSGPVNQMSVKNSDFEYNGQLDASHGNGFDLAGGPFENITVDGGSFSHNTKAGINMKYVKDSTFKNLSANYNEFGIKADHWGAGKIENILFENVTAKYNTLDGITIQPEKENAIDGITITGATLHENGRYGLGLCYVYTGTNNPQMTDVSISDSSIVGNESMGMRVYSWWETMEITEVFDATQNWWGDETGPYHDDTNLTGQGNAVSDNVLFDPWWADEEMTEKVSNKPVHNTTQDEYYDTIQAAIDDADPGDTIEVAAGTYAEDVNINVYGLQLLGPNAGKPGHAEDRGDEAIIEGPVLVNADNVTVAGFFIDGSNVDQGPALKKRGILVGNTASQSNIGIKNNIIKNWVTGISLAGGGPFPWNEDVHIEGNLLINNGIGSTENVGKLTVINNTFDNGGVSFGGGAVLDVPLTGNDFRNGTRYISAAAGVDLKKDIDTILAQNTFDRAAAVDNVEGQWYKTAIFSTISGAVSVAAENAVITVIAGTYEEDVTLGVENLTIKSLSGAQDTTIKGGTIHITANGVTLEGFTIDNEGGERAIAPRNSNGATIKDNVIENSERGIQGDYYGSPSNLTVDGNTFKTPRGIVGTEGMTNLVIVNNTFENSTVSFADTAVYVFSLTSMTNNHFKDGEAGTRYITDRRYISQQDGAPTPSIDCIISNNTFDSHEKVWDEGRAAWLVRVPEQ